MTIGLSTYRWNNSIKPLLLLALFPFPLLAFLTALFHVVMLFITFDEGITREDFRRRIGDGPGQTAIS